VRHKIEYLIVRALVAMTRVMPDALVRACGAGLGLVFYVFDVPHRRTAARNLAAAFPSRSNAERRRIVRRAFMHFGSLLFELLKFSTFTAEEMAARVEVEGEDRARLAYAQGRGVIFATGHFGCWEMQGIGHGLHFGPIGVLVRALDNPQLNALLERMREKTGNTVIYRRAAIRRVMRMLQAGQGVAILIDQHIQSRDAVYVDFFNRPAATTTAVAALALRTGAVVIPTFTLPIGRSRYRMVYEPPIPPPRGESREALQEFTQRCTDVLEMYVRRNPELWLWMHRRWRENDAAIAGDMSSAVRRDQPGADEAEL
jgi:KDO2-lipid IV(A) lauroyltransferase